MDSAPMTITDLEAHYLLFAVDAYLGTGRDGKVAMAKNGLPMADWQSLRDRLFAAHDHPQTES